MKAISLWQPWASLWLTDRKVHETRHWATKHRGALAVHAAQRVETDLPREFLAIVEAQFGKNWSKELPRGAVLGAVDLISIVQMPAAKPAHDDDWLCGNWEDGRFAWKRAAIITLREPISCRGRQSIFTLPDEIAAKISSRDGPMGHFP